VRSARSEREVGLSVCCSCWRVAQAQRRKIVRAHRAALLADRTEAMGFALELRLTEFSEVRVRDYAGAERVNRRCGYHVRAALGVPNSGLATQKGR